MDDFKAYLESSIEKEQLDQKTSIINQMFTQDTVNPRSSQPITSTERNNFLVFSTYKISVVDPEKLIPPQESNYIGIASMFFELGSSGSAEAHAAQP